MFKREAAVVVVGDASETTYAGYTPNGELPAAIQVPFTAAEQQRMAARQFSSTSREAIGLCKVVHVVLKQLPAELLSRQRIQFIGDNQGCISVFQHMRGQPEVVQHMKAMRLAVAAADAEIEYVWQPRESAEIRQADALSKEIDTSDIILSKRVTSQLCQKFGQPTCDAFATSVDNGSKADCWYSKFFEPGCSGVNGLRHAWGDKQLVWVFPPFDLVAVSIKKVQEEQVHCVLIVPQWTRFWSAMLAELPVVEEVLLAYTAGLYRLTSRVPKEWHGNQPRIPLRALHIKYK